MLRIRSAIQRRYLSEVYYKSKGIQPPILAPKPPVEKSDDQTQTLDRQYAAQYILSLHKGQLNQQQTWQHFNKLSGDSRQCLRLIDYNHTMSRLRGSRAERVDTKIRAKIMEVYQELTKGGLEPDQYTYQELISVNMALWDFKEARRWFNEMRARGIEPTLRLYRTMLHGYGAAKGELENARELWMELKERHQVDIKTYTCMIAAECQEENFQRALELVDEMESQGTMPDLAVRNILLKAVTRHRGLAAGVEEAQLMEASGMALDGYSYSILVGAALDEKSEEEIRRLLRESTQRGVVPSSEIVRRLVRHFDSPLEILQLMSDIPPDRLVRVSNTLVKTTLRANQFGRALQIIGHMRQAGIHPNVVTYGLVLDALSKAGKMEEAQKVFREVFERGELEPDLHIFGIMVDVCGKSGDTEAMFGYKRMMEAQGLAVEEPVVHNSILATLARRERVDLQLVMTTADELVEAELAPNARTFNSVFAAFVACTKPQISQPELEFLRRWYGYTKDKYRVRMDPYTWPLIIQSFINAQRAGDAMAAYQDMKQTSETNPWVLMEFVRKPDYMLGLMRMSVKGQKYQTVLGLWRDWGQLRLPDSEQALGCVLYACDQLGHPKVAQGIVTGLITPEKKTFAPQMVGEAALAVYLGILVKHQMTKGLLACLELWRAAGSRRLSEGTVAKLLGVMERSSDKTAREEFLRFVDKHFPNSLPI